MFCILFQFDPPRDPQQLAEYTHWLEGEGGRLLQSVEGLSELRAFRNLTGGSPLVSVMAFFPEKSTALALGRSPLWSQLLSNLTR